MSSACINVLLIEDNPGDAELVRLALKDARARYHIDWVDTLQAALEKLSSTAFDAVISDLSLPDSQGVEGVRAIRACAPDMPIVMLTSMSSDRLAIEALDEGAQDYLIKDAMTGDILERALRYAIQRQKNTEMRCLLDKVRRSQRQLARKNKRLAKLYRMAHHFVDNVSHEFRTPLTVILEYVSMLKEGLVGELNDEQRRILDVSADRADDLNNMVNDMLDVSKLSAGILGISRKAARIEEVIEHVRPNLEKKAELKGVSLEFATDESLPEVYCDPEKIGRVLINLAVNAIKFSGQPGKVRIGVEVDSLAPQVIVSVTDNGPGIDPKRLNELFERFKQLGTQVRGSTQGFGLGLNIAKNLVELNFGEITVVSGPEGGSTFSFSVPENEPLEITRRYLRRMQASARELSLVQAQVREVTDSTCDDVDAYLNCLLRRHDVVFRTDRDQWILLLAATAEEVEQFQVRAKQVWRDTNHNRPYGALPEVTLNRIGTWNARHEAGKILDALRVLNSAHASALA